MNRVSQREIAKVAGVTQSAVSRALRNGPSIPAETRERIQRIAREMGYEPDPGLASLAAYRLGKRPRGFRGTLAWLVRSAPGFSWQEIAVYRNYFEGARERASRLGYELSIFDLAEYAGRLERLAGVFRARNIEGILACPQPESDYELDFHWEQFAAVTFGFTLKRPSLHTVVETQFRGMAETMRQLRLIGYRRIGFAVSKRMDRRGDHNYLGAYCAEQYLAKAAPLVWEAEDAGGGLDSLGRVCKIAEPEVGVEVRAGPCSVQIVR